MTRKTIFQNTKQKKIIRQLLGKNLDMTRRKEMNEKNKKTDTIRRLIGNFGGSPSGGRRILSNLKERDRSKIDVDPNRNPGRALSPDSNFNNTLNIDKNIKARLNSKLDIFIKNPQNPNEKPIKPRRISRQGMNQEFQTESKTKKIILSPVSGRKMRVSKTKSKGLIDMTDQNLNKTKVLTIDSNANIKDYSIDKRILDMSGKSSLLSKIGNKHVKQLDNTLELINTPNYQREAVLSTKRNQSVRKNKDKLRHFKDPYSLKMDTSATSAGSGFSGKTIDRTKIKLIKKDTKASSTQKESNNMGDESICKILSNDGDNSFNTFMGNNVSHLQSQAFSIT